MGKASPPGFLRLALAVVYVPFLCVPLRMLKRRRTGCPALAAGRRMTLREVVGREQESGHVEKGKNQQLPRSARFVCDWINITDYAYTNLSRCDGLWWKHRQRDATADGRTGRGTAHGALGIFAY